MYSTPSFSRAATNRSDVFMVLRLPNTVAILYMVSNLFGSSQDIIILIGFFRAERVPNRISTCTSALVHVKTSVDLGATIIAPRQQKMMLVYC